MVWCRESNPVRAPIRATSTEQTHCSTSPPGTSTTSLGAFQFVLQTSDFYKNQTQTQSGLEPTTFTTAHQAPISLSYWICLMLTVSFTFHSFQPQHSKINQESNPRLSVFTAALYLPELISWGQTSLSERERERISLFVFLINFKKSPQLPRNWTCNLRPAHQAPISPSYWIWMILTLSFTFHSLFFFLDINFKNHLNYPGFEPTTAIILGESNLPPQNYWAGRYQPELLDLTHALCFCHISLFSTPKFQSRFELTTSKLQTLLSPCWANRMTPANTLWLVWAPTF